jgi:uncharacterized coiled-coil protein SlyX
MLLTLLVSLTAWDTQAQEVNQNEEICFSKVDAQTIIKNLKERDLFNEEITLLKETITKRDESIILLDNKINLLESTLKNREEMIDTYNKTLTEAKKTIEDSQKIIKEQQSQITKAKILGFSIGGIGVGLAILALVASIL